MSLISLSFLIFMALLLPAYYLLPRQHQWKLLLAASLIFYSWGNPAYIVFIFISIVTTWALMRNPTKQSFIITVILNLSILISFRYSPYLGLDPGPIPLGISFYTFMTIGYAHDCLDRKITPASSPFKYALFIFYFPQLTQGPIGTYKNMEPELFAPHEFDRERFLSGCYRVLRGIFKKLVIAGRLKFYVDTVYHSPASFGGLTLIVATFFYAIELYCDFSGYMDIVCGISEMLGIKLAENFNRPYFSKNIPEYWRRWHITLNEWFNTHLFMPAVTSKWNKKLSKPMYKLFPKAKKGTIRMLAPLFLVWVITGVWHGAEAVYLCWGLYFAVIMVLSFFTKSYVERFCKKIHYNPENPVIKVFQVLRTFILVVLGEVMFRAETIGDALCVYKNIFTSTRISASELAAALVPFGNGNQAAASVLIIFFLIAGLFVTELSQELRPNAATKHPAIFAGAMLMFTILLGMAGQSAFMYQAF